MRLFTRCIPVLFGVAAVLGLCCAPQPAAAQRGSEVIPKEVKDLLFDLSDIDKLRVLNPLNLSEAQLEKIIDVLTKAREVYLKKVTDVAVPPIKDMAAEIKTLRKKLLTGGDIPSDFDKRVKKIQDDFVERRDTEDQRTLKSLSESIKPIFTSSQYDKAINTAKSATKKDGKPTLKGTDEQFFNFYVKGVFMDYDSILVLLEDMKKARAAGSDKTASTRSSLPKVARK